jgi:uncharacterized protein YbjQ (UPF0145 family)
MSARGDDDTGAGEQAQSPGAALPAESRATMAPDDREQEESLERIERGELPLNAERRLERMAREGGAFTSELSVAEFALAHKLKLRPLAQVMGSCVYQVGWQYAGEALYRGPGTYSQELRVISDAWNEARSRALSRLQREAALLQADAVVGVHLQSGRYEWAENSVEFAVFGTAVRGESTSSRHGEAILTDLSLQDYSKLAGAGIEPCGLVAATSCFFVMATNETQMMGGLIGGMAFRNQELVPYTQGVYEARETALQRLTDQIRAAGGDGMVGVNITHHIQAHQMKLSQMGQAVPGLMVTFHAAGTAVRDGERTAEYPPETTVSLST